jgi:ferredoxin
MKYKIEIAREDCIACGNCYSVDPNHFEAGEEGYSRVIGGTTTRDFSEGTFDDNEIDKAFEAEEECPVQIISVIEM